MANEETGPPEEETQQQAPQPAPPSAPDPSKGHGFEIGGQVRAPAPEREGVLAKISGLLRGK